MNNVIESPEIELYDFPYQAPLNSIDERLACIPHGYSPAAPEPDVQNFIERDLYDLNPEDHEWRVKQKFFNDLPVYLMKYFANRYKQAYIKKGRAVANTYLREKMVPAIERARLVLHKYKNLPTTQKVALLSEEFADTEQSDFTCPGQIKFDFEQVEKSRKPVKRRLLAELEASEIKDMAFKISQIVQVKFQRIVQKIASKELIEEEIPEVIGYEELAEFVTQFGIAPPRKLKEQTELTALNDISRMLDSQWWYGRLNRSRKIMREHLAIAMGQVSSKASPYSSWDCVREHQEQQKANYNYIKQHQLIDEMTGEEVDMWDMVKGSVANPAIRRHELMVRCRGCEEIGNELGLQGLFLTLTTPSKYHNSYKKGGFIEHWEGTSPRDAQDYLNNVWQRIRAKLGRDEIRWFGVRVAEPHHDGTPHWHLLIWVRPEDVADVRKIFIYYAVEEDKNELYPMFDRNETRATKKQAIQGPINYKPRCDLGYIDPEKGTATGYIAKYISKNIDGYAMDGELSDETGKSVKDIAKNVGAWKSRWNIRQFQFFGGAPVTTYRELRRFANQNKNAFMQYLFMQERVDLLSIYSMLQRDLVGPIKPSRLISNEELLQVMGDSYESRSKDDDATIIETLRAADKGNWQGYIMGQGGPFVKRADLMITNVYEELPFASPHGETVRKLEGFQTPESVVKTRLKVWTIQKKSEENAEAEAITQGSEVTAISHAVASRSSVNNCTEPAKEQVNTQLTRLLQPDRLKGSFNDQVVENSALSALLKGSSLRLDDKTSLKIRPAEVDEQGKTVRPAQLVEVKRYIEDDSWMNFEGWDQVFKDSEPKQKDEYQQPDLSFFAERDDWPLI